MTAETAQGIGEEIISHEVLIVEPGISNLSIPGADPFVLVDNLGLFHLYQASNASSESQPSIALPHQPELSSKRKSPSVSITARTATTPHGVFTAEERTIFIPPSEVDGVEGTAEWIWAPECHRLPDGSYRMLFTMSFTPNGVIRDFAAKNHANRMYTADAASPVGPFSNVRRLFDPQYDTWAIDPTPLGTGHVLFSSWLGGKYRPKKIQFLDPNIQTEYQHICIAKLDEQGNIVSGSTTPLFSPIRESDAGVNEGPQIFTIGGVTYCYRSVGPCWELIYGQKVSRLKLGADPMLRESWTDLPGYAFGHTNIGHPYIVYYDGIYYLYKHVKPTGESSVNRLITIVEIVYRDGGFHEVSTK